ncbi:hypothetical protein [Clostridium sp. CAG:221]|jgi:hypothetical protein|nr:hypothetical protein [Clostridium sp. CAG:221]
MSDELMMKILRDFLLLFSRNSGRVSSFILHSSLKKEAPYGTSL